MTSGSTRDQVLVVTGMGDMGVAVAHRLGSGATVVLADVDEPRLARVEEALAGAGYAVHTVRTDVSSAEDVTALARVASSLGPIRSLVHTAGVSPVQASAEQIIAVDLVGTARVLDAFEPHVRPGTVAVCIASMAAILMPVAPETLALLAVTPTEELATLPVLDPSTLEPGIAYSLAKRGVQVRVEAASVAWGRRGGRVVSISPGVIATAQGTAELAGPSGDTMRGMVELSACRRLGTPDEIAAAAEFLVSPAASLVTGTDLLVDGGVVAAIRHQSAAEGSAHAS
ncbi:MAG TPA: SDR family oxidoreductase [Acidimicrobiia bacterium]|nr:SDR family oxidoreductase [Acidimicrobiia bacterium]